MMEIAGGGVSHSDYTLRVRVQQATVSSDSDTVEAGAMLNDIGLNKPCNTCLGGARQLQIRKRFGLLSWAGTTGRILNSLSPAEVRYEELS